MEVRTAAGLGRNPAGLASRQALPCANWFSS